MMQSDRNNQAFRILLLITDTKLTEKAEKLFKSEELPIHYKINAMGTASSEMMDILGLGTPEKSFFISIMTKKLADKMIRKAHNELKFNIPGNGIGFTLFMTGANSHIFKMLCEIEGKDSDLAERKDDRLMSEIKRTLIIAVVNHGYSEEVMNSAKEKGATGGTVIHGKHIGDEEASALWGLSIKKEKDLVLIVADFDKRLDIMKAIGESCGIHTEAKGIIVSTPIDAVVGLDNTL